MLSVSTAPHVLCAENVQAAPEQLSHLLRNIGIGFGIATATIMLAPAVLPYIGIGDEKLVGEAIGAMHGLELGDGLAGNINKLLNQVPWIGPTLVEGGLPTAAIVGTMSVGGWMLGNFVEQGEGKTQARLGKMIRYASLATSALVALPSAITALGVGLVYLAAVTVGGDLPSELASVYAQTLGVGGESSVAAVSFAGAAAALPHVLTCGASLIPLGFASKHALKKPFENSESTCRTLNDSLQLIITPDTSLKVGEPTHATLKILDNNTGKPLSTEDLSTVHTEKLHLFIVDSSLSDYQHIHPTPTDNLGEFSFSFTPHTSNKYQCWADITLNQSHENHKLATEIKGERRISRLPAITTNYASFSNGLQIDWQPTPLQQGADAMVNISIKDMNGKLFDGLEPVMGAYAHLVGFSADGTSIIHCHPIGAEPTSPSDRGQGNLQFHIEPDCSGPVQFYLQIKKNNEDVFVPFGQFIAPTTKAIDRLNYEKTQQYANSDYQGLAHR